MHEQASSALSFKEISLKMTITVGEESVLIAYIIQSFKSSLFCSLSESPPLMRKAKCKCIPRTLQPSPTFNYWFLGKKFSWHVVHDEIGISKRFTGRSCFFPNVKSVFTEEGSKSRASCTNPPVCYVPAYERIHNYLLTIS